MDIENSKKKSALSTISSTLALTIVLFEDVIKAVKHNTLINSDDPQDPQPDVILMNRTETFVGFVFEGGIIKNEEYSPIQKESLKLLEGLFMRLWLLEILQNFPLYLG